MHIIKIFEMWIYGGGQSDYLNWRKNKTDETERKEVKADNLCSMEIRLNEPVMWLKTANALVD